MGGHERVMAASGAFNFDVPPATAVAYKLKAE
jgi:hypothetical protein